MALEPDRWVFSMVSEPNVSQGSLWMLPGALLGPWQNHVTTLVQNRWNISETIMLPSCYPHVTLMLPSCYPHVTLMPLTCPSLAAHLPLTCPSLAPHLPLTDLMWATKVSTITKKDSKECVGKGMFGKFLPVLTWRRPMCVFHCKYHMFWRVRESPRVRHLEPFWLTLAPLSVWIWQNHVTTLLQNRWNISETIMLPPCYPHVTLMLPSCYTHAPHLPLTCPSLAPHLPLTCPSLTSCGPPRSQQLQKKAQRSVLVRACLENSFLCSPESAQCVFFVVNTICSEGSFTALCHHVNGYGVSKCHDTVTN
jgi:hypothetical protein